MSVSLLALELLVEPVEGVGAALERAREEVEGAGERLDVREHQHALIEVDIEQNTSALVAHTGIGASCFSDENSKTHVSQHSCYVGDSLLRNLWCWRERGTIANCSGHTDLAGRSSHFFWKPTLDDVTRGNYTGCQIIVWDNLFHEVRQNPALFANASARARSLQRVYALLLSQASRVVFYVAQRPRSSFADERHAHVSMLDAWRVDSALANTTLAAWLTVRADLYTLHFGEASDGRHYDAETVKTLSGQLNSLLATR